MRRDSNSAAHERLLGFRHARKPGGTNGTACRNMLCMRARLTNLIAGRLIRPLTTVEGGMDYAQPAVMQECRRAVQCKPSMLQHCRRPLT